MEILNLAIVGAFLSAIFQLVKKYIVEEFRLFFIIILCIIAGTIYYFIQSNAVWLNIVSLIITFANVAYLAIVKPVDKKLNK